MAVAEKGKKAKPRRAAAPTAGAKSAAKGDRDAVTGQFLPGCTPGPGRPRGINFQQLVRERTKNDGTLEEAVFDVFETLVLLATKKGDVPAAKLLLDRVCLKDPDLGDDDDDPGLSHDDRMRRLLLLLGGVALGAPAK